jgi:capsule polysaccharide export protein KpsE/RkpR
MNTKDNILDVIGLLFKWKKPVIWTTAAAAILSIIISLTLPTYYKASTIFYSASPDLAKPIPVGPMEKDIDYYGEPEDLDRLFSLANSNEVADFMIEKFDLYGHYDINPESRKGPYKIKQKFFKLYQTQKTKYDAINLEVEDVDPVIAANIANDAREKINRMSQKLIKESQSKLLKTYLDNISNKEKELEFLNDSLVRSRKLYGVYNSESQGESLAELQAKVQGQLNNMRARLETYSKKSGRFRDSINYLTANISGLEHQNDALKIQLNQFNNGLALVMTLEKEQEEFGIQLSLDKERYKQLLSTFNNDFSGLHVVEWADVPIVKSRPKRSIYVIAATMIGFIFSVIGVLLIETYQSINWKKVINAK